MRPRAVDGKYGDNLFRRTDRRDNDMLPGPTHEELFTPVKGEYSSTGDLPLILFQIQTKYATRAVRAPASCAAVSPS